MPELPDIEAYLAALRPRIVNVPIDGIDLLNPFLLRTVEPPIDALVGRDIVQLSRLGKRIVFHIDNGQFLILHLMIAGRLRWLAPGARASGKIMLAALRFSKGTLAITEAGSKRRAMLHVAADITQMQTHDPGGIEPLTCTLPQFSQALTQRNHTLKRALTDPQIIAGIGNAFSDEILLAARLSPLKWTQKLTDDELARLHNATKSLLEDWTARLSERYQKKFPGAGEVTAFRPEFGAHGKFKYPCRQCATTIQRIRYADNETNYCPACQTDGKVLADRSLSRLLKSDWPRSIEELM